MKRIGRGNADRRWDVLPQQPSLAYDLAQNRLIVTAAALQDPIFNAQSTAATKFGSYGALVGHELTRAIDAKGALIDARGELRSWWTPADKTAWTLLATRVATQYSAYDFPGVKGAKVNGALTADNNLADVAGLELAWEAYRAQEPNAKPAEQQDFFRAWAALWPQQVSPNEAGTADAAHRCRADPRLALSSRHRGTKRKGARKGALSASAAPPRVQRSAASRRALRRLPLSCAPAVRRVPISPNEGDSGASAVQAGAA
jgi:putative endopeptidase